LIAFDGIGLSFSKAPMVEVRYTFRNFANQETGMGHGGNHKRTKNLLQRLWLMVQILQTESPGIEEIGCFSSCRIFIADMNRTVPCGKQITNTRVAPLGAKKATMKFVRLGQMSPQFTEGRNAFGRFLWDP
jgi:hypothetical protein